MRKAETGGCDPHGAVADGEPAGESIGIRQRQRAGAGLEQRVGPHNRTGAREDVIFAGVHQQGRRLHRDISITEVLFEPASLKVTVSPCANALTTFRSIEPVGRGRDVPGIHGTVAIPRERLRTDRCDGRHADGAAARQRVRVHEIWRQRRQTQRGECSGVAGGVKILKLSPLVSAPEIRHLQRAAVSQRAAHIGEILRAGSPVDLNERRAAGVERRRR